MSLYDELNEYGRHYLQNESYGISSYFFYRSIMEHAANNNAWNGLILSLSLMRREGDSQVALARFALQQGLDYDRDMITFAMMLWQNNPVALAEWLRAVSEMRGIESSTKQTLTSLAEDLEHNYQQFAAKHGADSFQVRSMVGLQDIATRKIELDYVFTHSIDEMYDVVKAWLTDEEKVLSAIRLLCMLPDPRSEKILRRICRNEEIDAKARTHALLSLRWLGVRGNAKIHKYGESFTINLDEPAPELTVSVPASFKPPLDRMKAWMAKEQGLITVDQYEEYVSNDAAELNPELKEKLDACDFPSIWQEVVHALIRAAYDQYYPLVPTITGTRQWSAAFLMLIKEYAVGTGHSWTYSDPEEDEIAVQHRNWLLSGTPDFYDSIAEAQSMNANS